MGNFEELEGNFVSGVFDTSFKRLDLGFQGIFIRHISSDVPIFSSVYLMVGCFSYTDPCAMELRIYAGHVDDLFCAGSFF